MKKLVIIRHAKSSWKFPELKDMERPLNKRGIKDAPLMAKVLKKIAPGPDLIISSPAVRAMEIAKVIASKLDYSKKKILNEPVLYFHSENEIIDLVKALDNKYKLIFLVGHNPVFTELVNVLSNSSIDNLPTSGAFGIQFDCENWSEVARGKGKEIFFEFPKKYRKEKSEEE